MEEMEEEDFRGAEERTFETILLIGNSVNPMIQLTVDYPEKHENGRVPILDLEVWMVRTEEGFQEIRYSFYEKPMKSDFVLMARSAVPMATKRAAVNETIRRLRNYHENVDEEEVAQILSRFCQKLRLSGYGEKFRREIIDAGVKAYEEQIRVEEAGGRQRFRTRDCDREERRKKKKHGKYNWWKKPGRSGAVPVTFVKVPFTHNSGLMKKMEKIARDSGMHVKFVETSGHSLQKGPTCGRER